MSTPLNPQRVLLKLDFPDGSRSVQIQLDASVNETHLTNAQITEHQVETGSNITDHIRPMPKKLSLEAVITNTPTTLPTTESRGVTGGVRQTQSGAFKYQALVFDGPFDRVADSYSDLVDATQAGAFVSIVTTLANYQNFAIENLSVPRNSQSGNAIQFTIDLKEIRTVDTEQVEGLPAKHKAPSKKKQPDNKGSQPPKPVDKESLAHVVEQASPFLKSFFGGGGGQ